MYPPVRGDGVAREGGGYSGRSWQETKIEKTVFGFGEELFDENVVFCCTKGQIIKDV